MFKFFTIIGFLFFLSFNLSAESISAQKSNNQFSINIEGITPNTNFQFYLDIDNNPNTGYFNNEGITGAEYIIENQTLMEFLPSGTSGNNWNSWSILPTSINVTQTTNSISAQLPLSAFPNIGSDIKVAVQILDANWGLVGTTYQDSNMKTITFLNSIPSLSDGFDWSLPDYADNLQNKNGGMIGEGASNDPEISGGFFEVLWYHSELQEGVFTFNHFDERLANTTGDVLVRLEVNSQCHAPTWTTIPFLSSQTLQFWRQEYIQSISGFINKFAERYSDNSRIVGVQLGIADGKYKTNSCPDVSSLDPNNTDDNNTIFNHLVYNFGRDGWGEFWLNDAEMAEATNQQTFKLTASNFLSKTKEIIDLYVNAFGSNKNKLILTNFDIFDGSDIGYPAIQSQMDTIASYAVSKGIGNRGGEIESWMRYTNNVYGVNFVTGNNTDGSCAMTFDEDFADTINGRYWGDENEFYGPGTTSNGPTSNQSYRFFVSSMRALQLRRNYFSIGDDQLNFLRNFNDEFNTASFITYLSKVLGRSRQDTPDTFVLLGERTLDTSYGLYPKEYKGTTEPCLVTGDNRGYTTVNEFGRWLSVVSATERDLSMKKNMPKTENNWGLNLIADRGNNTFYELYARKSPSFLFDINDQLMQERCPSNCNLEVKVVFKDSNITNLQVEHETGASTSLTTLGDGKVKTASFPIYGHFSNGLNNADFRIKTSDNSKLSILMARINIGLSNPQKPSITSPINGSQLLGSAVTFQLNSNGENISNWNIRIGSNLGNNNIANRFAAGSSTSINVNNLPNDNSTIFVRLQYKENGIWKIAGDYTYTASALLSQPLITSPITGSTLSGSTETFTLNNNGITLSNWNLRVGTSVGSNNIANRFAGSSSTSIPITNLPTDSSIIYIRLQYKENGTWKVAGDYTYTASGPVFLPLITSPTTGTTLSGSTETFTLNNNSITLTNWNLRVGTTAGSYDLANRFASSSATSLTVNNLPTDSSTVYVRLQYKENGTWKVAGDYTYTASGPVSLPLITSPVAGSNISGSTQIFTLDNNGISLTNWNLRVGTSIGSYNLANRFASGLATSLSITNLPTDSSTVYVRLQYKENGVWKLAGDYTYTASN